MHALTSSSDGGVSGERERAADPSMDVMNSSAIFAYSEDRLRLGSVGLTFDKQPIHVEAESLGKIAVRFGFIQA